MTSNRPYTLDGTVAALAVRVTPRAARSEVTGLVETGEGRIALAVRLAAPPLDGAANRALIAMVANALGVPKGAVTLASGGSSRLKRLRIEGADPDRLARLCGQ